MAMPWRPCEYGLQDGNQSLYVSAEGVNDGGWRLHSPSDLVGFMPMPAGVSATAKFMSWPRASQSGLGVVGPTPIQLAQKDSAAVYTWPQTTQNRIGSLAVNGKTKLADHWQLEGSAYVRSLRQRHVDGNDGNFESCSAKGSYGGDLCLQDDAFGTPAGGKTVGLPQPVHHHGPAGQMFPFSSQRRSTARSTAPSSTPPARAARCR